MLRLPLQQDYQKKTEKRSKAIKEKSQASQIHRKTAKTCLFRQVQPGNSSRGGEANTHRTKTHQTFPQVGIIIPLRRPLHVFFRGTTRKNNRTRPRCLSRRTGTRMGNQTTQTPQDRSTSKGHFHASGSHTRHHSLSWLRYGSASDAGRGAGRHWQGTLSWSKSATVETQVTKATVRGTGLSLYSCSRKFSFGQFWPRMILGRSIIIAQFLEKNKKKIVFVLPIK